MLNMAPLFPTKCIDVDFVCLAIPEPAVRVRYVYSSAPPFNMSDASMF